MHSSDTVVLIPARNESATVGQVVRTVIAKTGWPVVVIDDASTDDTGLVATLAGAIVLQLPFQLGAWGAIQTGIRYALSEEFHYAITMDADGQHLADALPLLHNGLSKRFGVVIGACPSRVNEKRRIGWLFFRKLTGLRIEDLTSGLRAYNHAAMTLLSSRQATLLEFQDIGVLMLLRSAGLHIKEIYVPMENRVVGRSKIYPSWLAIAYYLLKTTLICVRKRSYVD
jgi:glycosyltransferase involved in cell wall biosynthesis